jgi:hypothetical protein
MMGHQPHCVSTFQNTASAVFILCRDGIVVASIELPRKVLPWMGQKDMVPRAAVNRLTNEHCSFVIGHGGSGHPCAILRAQHTRAAAAGQAPCPCPMASPCPLVGSGSSADAAYAAGPALPRRARCPHTSSAWVRYTPYPVAAGEPFSTCRAITRARKCLMGINTVLGVDAHAQLGVLIRGRHRAPARAVIAAHPRARAKPEEVARAALLTMQGNCHRRVLLPSSCAAIAVCCVVVCCHRRVLLPSSCAAAVVMYCCRRRALSSSHVAVENGGGVDAVRAASRGVAGAIAKIALR